MALIVAIQNISQLAAVSDYRYEVRVGDGTAARSRTLASGVVKAHACDDGWKALVQRVLDEAETRDPLFEAMIEAERTRA